jgi:hypothetical protein
MTLKSLKIQVQVAAGQTGSGATVLGEGARNECGFCGLPAGLNAMQIGDNVACVLCGLAQSLHRSTIDEEARLIWLPEMTQAALNVLVRQIHLELREQSESIFCEDTPDAPEGSLPLLYMAQRILLDRSQAIVDRLGSCRPGDLADALSILAQRHGQKREFPLSGLRVFPAGRFFVGGVDVYAAIVDSWSETPVEPEVTDLIIELAEVV